MVRKRLESKKTNQEFVDMNILKSENIVQRLNIYIFSQISRFGCWNVILYLSLWSLSDWCLHSCIYSLYVAVWIWISDFIIFHLKHFWEDGILFEYQTFLNMAFWIVPLPVFTTDMFLVTWHPCWIFTKSIVISDNSFPDKTIDPGIGSRELSTTCEPSPG